MGKPLVTDLTDEWLEALSLLILQPVAFFFTAKVALFVFSVRKYVSQQSNNSTYK
jgi:hypothetical protein